MVTMVAWKSPMQDYESITRAKEPVIFHMKCPLSSSQVEFQCVDKCYQNFPVLDLVIIHPFKQDRLADRLGNLISRTFATFYSERARTVDVCYLVCVCSLSNFEPAERFSLDLVRTLCNFKTLRRIAFKFLYNRNKWRHINLRVGIDTSVICCRVV